MKSDSLQESLLKVPMTGDLLAKEPAARALDELFELTRTYRSSKDFHSLMQFIGQFRFYSPFNAMLVYMQRPGARFVAPPNRWKNQYCQRIKAGANPLVILQPMGPVMFVFDVIDVEPLPNAPQLPFQVTQPFEVRKGHVGSELSLTVENAKRDGVRVSDQEAGSQSAGQIAKVSAGDKQRFQVKFRPEEEFIEVSVRYQVLVNKRHSLEAQYATLVHELAHLYCGHLGTPNSSWWPDRAHHDNATEEFEAESVCYLICERLGIDNPSAEYLSNFVGQNNETPPISLDCVMKATGLIEQMGQERLKPRKEKEK